MKEESINKNLSESIKKALKILISFLLDLHKKEKMNFDKLLHEQKLSNMRFLKKVEELKLPEIPPAKITVTPPEINIPKPEVIIKDRELPTLLNIRGFTDLAEKIKKAIKKESFKVDTITKENPLPVILTYDEKFYRLADRISTGGGWGLTNIEHSALLAINTLLSEVIAGSSKLATEDHGHENVKDGTVALTNAGTAQQLPDIACKRVYIECSEWNGDAGNCPNGGAIVIGGANVVAALATRRGKTLYPTQGDWFKVSNLNLLYFDGLDDGAKLNYFIEV